MKLGMIMHPDENGFKYIKEVGLNSIEIPMNSTEDVNARIAMKDSVKACIDKYGIPVASMGRWGQDSKVSPDGEINWTDIDECKQAIALAAELGCPTFCTGINYANNISRYKNYTVGMKIIGELIKYSDDKGVRLAMYNCSWSNYIYSPAEWDIFLGEFPTLGIKFDPSHTMERDQKYLEQTMAYGDKFTHVHIKGVIMDHAGHYDNPPAGLDLINWNAFLGALYYRGYKGALSIEPHSSVWHGELGDRGVRQTMKYINNLLV